MAENEIPWGIGNRSEIYKQLLEKSITHQPHDKSSINWAGIPDSLIERMKVSDVMPEKGIANRIMFSGPWEPKWFRSYNQKAMPNNTEFIYFDYNKMD
jgi:hypothetical protein